MEFTVFVFLLVSAIIGGRLADSHNISAILDGFPDYSLYRSYLVQTRVADEINTRETVTVLVLPNAPMSALAAKRSLVSIKSALRLLTLLDYFDAKKLRDISNGTALVTTLLQTTGTVEGNLGFVNITDFSGGRFGFASASPGSKFDSFYTKSVKQIPYSISVLEVSAPIVFPGLLDTPTRSDANLTLLLEQAGCKTFLSLITTSGVLKTFQFAMAGSLTLLAPNDEAFKAANVPDLNKLSSADITSLLEYHAVPDYVPKASLVSKSPIKTLASGNSGKFELTATARGDDVTLNAGMDTSRVASTVVDDAPFCILTIDSVLLPSELFGNKSALAPSPSSPSPSPPATAQAPATAKAPPPAHRSSPPAPPTESPTDSPADAPDSAAADSIDDYSEASGAIESRVLLLLAVFTSFVFLS